MKPRIEFLTFGREKLALHSWVPAEPLAVIFYIHGIQSHAGWLFETGPALATHGVATYVLDRRGSGQSEGTRGHVDHFKTWIEDYTSGINFVRGRHAKIHLTLVGQSLGGALLAGVVANGAAAFDALVFCAPALNQLSNLPAERLQSIKQERSLFAQNPDRGLLRQPVPLKDEWYASDSKYLSFMKNDPLMLREITLQTVLARFDLEEFYLSEGKAWPRLPTAFVQPGKDMIIDLDIARKSLLGFTQGNLLSLEIPVDDHYLEFSSHRGQYLSFLASYVKTNGFCT